MNNNTGPMKYTAKTIEAGYVAWRNSIHLGVKVADWRRRNAMMVLQPDMRTRKQRGK
jgi:hypothetical protein